VSLVALVHGLHVAAGIAWVGGQVLVALCVWPAVLRQPAPEARRLLDVLAPPIGRLMMLSGSAALLLGVLRATWLGPVRSWAFAAGTAYGRTCLVALALTVAASVHGARTERLIAGLFDGDRLHPQARARVAAEQAVSLALAAGIVAAMVALRFGV
jgi:uncharacterized membrane protein